MSNFAMIFPGQGSQSVGMLKELADKYSIVRETFEEASDVLGYDLWKLVQEGTTEDLGETHRTQPAILASSVAIWRVYNELYKTQPTVMAGHSLGEYSALVCAGVIEFRDAIKLVELRGLMMQEAVPAGIGAMSAIIGLDDLAIKDACEQAAKGEVVAPVNYNSPGQVVIAGNKDAVLRANDLCKEAGAKRALLLPVSVPSHCELMKPAAEQLANTLKTIEFKTPVIPVINNVNVTITNIPAEIKDALVLQLFSPVRWTETINKIASLEIENLYEMGPGKVLTGLTRRINKSLVGRSVNSPDTIVLDLK